MITADLLHKVFPYAGDTADWANHIELATSGFGIDTPIRQAHFLAQIGAETGELQHLEENLDYSAVRLLAVWPKRFTVETAAIYANQPTLLGNMIYRGINGNTQLNDGYRFRGRGCFMTTGRYNYDLAASALCLPLVEQPDLLTDPQNAVDSAAAFWQEHKLNAFADDGDLASITRIINGGVNGLGQRAMYLSRLQEYLK